MVKKLEFHLMVIDSNNTGGLGNNTTIIAADNNAGKEYFDNDSLGLEVLTIIINGYLPTDGDASLMEDELLTTQKIANMVVEAVGIKLPLATIFTQLKLAGFEPTLVTLPDAVTGIYFKAQKRL
jgi:hypothetical protein